MSAFDDLTMAEVDHLQNVVLAGRTLADPASDPLKVAGGVLWLTLRRTQPDLTWEDFTARTTMGEIKAFSSELQTNPTNGPNGPTS